MKDAIWTSSGGSLSRCRPSSSARSSVVEASSTEAATPSVPLARTFQAPHRPLTLSGQAEHVDPLALRHERHQHRERHERHLDQQPLQQEAGRDAGERTRRAASSTAYRPNAHTASRGVETTTTTKQKTAASLRVRRQGVHRRVPVPVELVRVAGAHVRRLLGGARWRDALARVRRRRTAQKTPLPATTVTPTPITPGEAAGEAGVGDVLDAVVGERGVRGGVLLGLLVDALVGGDLLQAVGVGGGVEADEAGEDEGGGQAGDPQPCGAERAATGAGAGRRRRGRRRVRRPTRSLSGCCQAAGAVHQVGAYGDHGAHGQRGDRRLADADQDVHADHGGGDLADGDVGGAAERVDQR